MSGQLSKYPWVIRPTIRLVNGIWRCKPDAEFVTEKTGWGLTPKMAYDHYEDSVFNRPWRHVKHTVTRTIPEYKRPESYGILYHDLYSMALKEYRNAPETYHINQGRVTHVT